GVESGTARPEGPRSFRSILRGRTYCCSFSFPSHFRGPRSGDLARQNGDWRHVALLGAQARRAQLKPFDPSECELFKEADRQVGRADGEEKLSSVETTRTR